MLVASVPCRLLACLTLISNSHYIPGGVKKITLLQYLNLWHPAHFDTFVPSGTYSLVPVDDPSVHV
jgi:hypothetical protein